MAVFIGLIVEASLQCVLVASLPRPPGQSHVCLFCSLLMNDSI